MPVTQTLKVKLEPPKDHTLDLVAHQLFLEAFSTIIRCSTIIPLSGRLGLLRFLGVSGE